MFPIDFFSTPQEHGWPIERVPRTFGIGAHRREQTSTVEINMGITFLYLHRIRSIRIHKINGKFQTIYFASFPQEHVPKTEDGSGLIRLCLNQFPRFLTGCTFCLEIIVKSRNLFDILFYFITINYHCRLASNFENKQLNMLVSSFPYHRKRVHLYMG